jgi:hypothetical protein
MRTDVLKVRISVTNTYSKYIVTDTRIYTIVEIHFLEEKAFYAVLGFEKGAK